MVGFYGATEAPPQPRAARKMGLGLLALAAVVGSVVVVFTASSQSAVELVAAPQMQMVEMPVNGQQQLVYMMPAQPGQMPGQMVALQPGQSLASAPVQASPSSLPVAVARPITQPVAARSTKHKVAPAAHPVKKPVHHLAKAPYPAETEAQAAAKAKVWARKAYLATYNEAMNAENAAEVQERKNRAARAQHFAHRAQMFDALKKKADRKEGYVKLEREMGMIMDGVDGLHYRGYKH